MTAGRIASALAAISLLCAGAIAVPSAAGGELTTIGLRNGEEERSFYLSRNRVKPGPALIQYTNTGEDPHDVKIKRKGSSNVKALPETQSGEVNTFPVMKLKADSRYILWCSLDGHRESGMEADLRVKQRSN
jgi:uncharacterized cupredoxin-like copper-binding protein